MDDLVRGNPREEEISLPDSHPWTYTLEELASPLRVRAKRSELDRVLGPFPGGRIEESLPQTERFRSRFHKLVGADVLNRALEGHPERRFELNAFAVPLAAHVREVFRLAGINREIFRPRIFAHDHP